VDMKEFTGEMKPSTQTRDVNTNMSIEAQVAAKEVGECYRAGLFKDDDKLVTLYRGWCESRLTAVPPSVMKPPTKSPEPASSPSLDKQPSDTLPPGGGDPLAGKDSSSKFATQPATNPQKKRILELNEARLGRAAQLIREWGWEAKDVTQLTRDQAKHLIEVMEREINASGESEYD